jgi:glycerophosphoryl diester phosphodiesterase
MMKFIAHRGASQRYIENTYQAFKYAFESSLDGCECDIRITKDHEFIVYHNENLLRLHHIKSNVGDLNVVDIKKIYYDDGQPILTLETLLVLHQHYDKWIFIEIKDNLASDQMELLSQLLLKFDGSKMILISFHLEVVVYFKQYFKVMYLKNQLDPFEIKRLQSLDIQMVNLNINYFDKKKHEHYIKSHLLVSYWTVDDQAMQTILKKEEVLFLTTNVVE